MRKTMLRVMTLFLLLAIPEAVVAGSLTYNIVDHGPYFQNGWSLSGTIVTDGTIGPIGPSDITFWQWTITNGEQTYTASSSDSFFFPTTDIQGEVLASSTEITLPYQEAYGHGNQPFNVLSLGLGVPRMVWYDLGALVNWADVPVIGKPWYTTVDTTDSWLIATIVPEPFSLYLLGFGAVCGSVYVMGHKRRGRTTAPTA